MKKIKIALTQEELDLVLVGLGELKAKDSFHLIGNLYNQFMAQSQKQVKMPVVKKNKK
jgi:DNA-binding transcriptional regulator LsrR (DeoR family)